MLPHGHNSNIKIGSTKSLLPSRSLVNPLKGWILPTHVGSNPPRIGVLVSKTIPSSMIVKLAIMVRFQLASNNAADQRAN